MSGFQRTAGFRQFNAVKTGFAVNGSCHFLLAHQRTVTSGMHRHVGGMRLFQHCTGVVGHLVKALIATYRGDAQQIDIGIAHGKQDGDGVIMSRIAINHNRQCHSSSLLALFCDQTNAVRRGRRDGVQNSVMETTIAARATRIVTRPSVNMVPRFAVAQDGARRGAI